MMQPDTTQRRGSKAELFRTSSAATTTSRPCGAAVGLHETLGANLLGTITCAVSATRAPRAPACLIEVMGERRAAIWPETAHVGLRLGHPSATCRRPFRHQLYVDGARYFAFFRSRQLREILDRVVCVRRRLNQRELGGDCPTFAIQEMTLWPGSCHPFAVLRPCAI